MIKSKTVKELWKQLLGLILTISGLIGLLSATLQGFFKETALVVSWISIGVLAILLLFLIIRVMDSKFYQIENTKEILDDLVNNKISSIVNNTNIIPRVESELNQLQTLSQLSAALVNIESMISSDIADFIFLQGGHISYLILIFKNDSSDSMRYELNINSVNMDVLRFETDMPTDNKKVRNVSFKNLNQHISGSCLNNINFDVNKGLSVGVIKILLNGQPSQMIKINISLVEKDSHKILFDNEQLTILV